MDFNIDPASGISLLAAVLMLSRHLGKVEVLMQRIADHLDWAEGDDVPTRKLPRRQVKEKMPSEDGY